MKALKKNYNKIHSNAWRRNDDYFLFSQFIGRFPMQSPQQLPEVKLLQNNIDRLPFYQIDVTIFHRLLKLHLQLLSI